MVGLSVVLETTKSMMRDSGRVICPKPPQILNKTAVMIAAYSSSSADLTAFHRQSSYPDPGEYCCLCRMKLLSGENIYMYKGGTFCSEECRSKQIFMDERESLSRKNRSLVAINSRPPAFSSSASSPGPASTSGGYTRRRRGPRNRAGGFAY